MPSPQDKSVIVSGPPRDGDLFARTLRTVAILVAACVLFVGGLSAAAVAIASKAVSAPTTRDAQDVAPRSPHVNKPDPPRSRADGTPI